jgi:peptidyl-tRNA hydrolase, PTH1 family
VILLVGLGNPGVRYAETRHNVGFSVVERIAARGGPGNWREKFSGQVADAEWGGARLLLLKPMTYMNESGRSVVAAASFYKVPANEVVVVHDELDLPFGTIRMKFGGGEAGNNGLKSISQHLSTKDYVRVRVGIGKPPAGFKGSGADFVLEGFAPVERAQLGDVVDRASDAVALLVEHGLEHAMNVTNRRAS